MTKGQRPQLARPGRATAASHSSEVSMTVRTRTVMATSAESSLPFSMSGAQPQARALRVNNLID